MSSSSPQPTIDDLLARVYRHYPRGLESDDPRHHATEESRRLACVYEAAAIACDKQVLPIADDERVPIDPDVRAVVDALYAWTAFGERCQQVFPDCVVWDESGPFFDPGYRHTVSKPGHVHDPARQPREWGRSAVS